jgi:hypothetical protein
MTRYDPTCANALGVMLISLDSVPCAHACRRDERKTPLFSYWRELGNSEAFVKNPTLYPIFDTSQ